MIVKILHLDAGSPAKKLKKKYFFKLKNSGKLNWDGTNV
jgi:hypothetical protein